METAPFESGRPGISGQWSHVSRGHGLSDFDIVSRQRYFENSRWGHSGKEETCVTIQLCLCRHHSGVDVAVSVASNPGLPPAACSSHKLHGYLQEQQKIVSSFRAQPWPMQMKLAAVRSGRAGGKRGREGV